VNTGTRAPALPRMEARNPLAQLLHALNQPLTGLQCAMEVTLARPRTSEQYVHALHDGLGLTERMRSLVEAIREVVDLEEDENKNKNKKEDQNTNNQNTNKKNTNKKKEDRETIELRTLVGEVLEDLEPVAEAKNVRMVLEGSGDFFVTVEAGRRRLAGTVFRLLESVLSLAAGGSVVRTETSAASLETLSETLPETLPQKWIRVGWQGAAPRVEFSRPELGLLVAQAGWEREGAKWERTQTGDRETVTIRLLEASTGSRGS
jgi:signal transduction histidine kinase